MGFSWGLSIESVYSTGEGNGYTFQYSYLENSIDRGTWRATVHKATKNWTQLKQFSTHTCTHEGLKTIKLYSDQIRSDQSLNRVQLFATP